MGSIVLENLNDVCWLSHVQCLGRGIVFVCLFISGCLRASREKKRGRTLSVCFFVLFFEKSFKSIRSRTLNMGAQFKKEKNRRKKEKNPSLCKYVSGNCLYFFSCFPCYIFVCFPYIIFLRRKKILTFFFPNVEAKGLFTEQLCKTHIYITMKTGAFIKDKVQSISILHKY